MVPITISSIKVASNKADTEPRVPSVNVEVITSNVLRPPLWTGIPLRDVCVTNARVARSLISSVLFYYYYYYCLSVAMVTWSLYYLFFDLRLLVIRLVSSNIFYTMFWIFIVLAHLNDSSHIYIDVTPLRNITLIPNQTVFIQNP